MAKKRFGRMGTALLVFPLLLVLLTGCGGGGGGQASSPARVVIAQGADVTTMDPHMHRETTTDNVLYHIYDPLLARGADMRLQPRLADSWRFLDNETVEFKLHPGVKFSNGEPFDAVVVKYNLDRVSGKLSGAKKTLVEFQYTSIRETRVVDPLTVRILLTAPDPLLLSKLSGLLMVPKAYTEQNGFEALETKPVGTGPYVLKEWIPQSRIVLARNEGYFRGRAAVEEVVFRPLPETATRLAELRAGGIDIAVGVPPQSAAELEGDQKLEIRSVPSSRVVYLSFNCLDNPLLADPRVRQAFNYAVDVDSVIGHLYGGRATRVATVGDKNVVGCDVPTELYPYDPERARQLLAEAGASSMTVEMLTPRGRFLNDAELAQAVAGYLEQVGVKVKINAVEFGVFAKLTQQRQIPDLMLCALGNQHFDALQPLTWLVRSGPQAFSWYANPEVDRLIDVAATTMDSEAHAQALRQALSLLRDDPPFVFLFALHDIYGVNRRVDWQPRSDERIYMYDARLR